MKHLYEYFIPALGRLLFTMWGGIVAVMEPRIPIILICFCAVFMDCYTAWSLSRRVRDKYPDRKTDAYFRSDHFGRVIITLIKISALIFLAAHMDEYIVDDIPVSLTKIAAGAICFWQVWSILENESSCNNAKWAKIAQRIMVDKTERHFDIDLHELKEDRKNKTGVVDADDTSNVNKKNNDG